MVKRVKVGVWTGEVIRCVGSIGGMRGRRTEMRSP